MKFTTRELLGFTAFVGLTVASMRVGGLLAALTFTILAVAANALLIVAFVDCTRRRAFAIGFLVPLLSYAGIHVLSNRDELDPYEDLALPTTRCLQPLYQAVAKSTWVDFATGKELPGYDPATDPSRHFGGGMMSPQGMVRLRQTPDRATFTLLAHSLIAFRIGVAGAKFGLYIHHSQRAG